MMEDSGSNLDNTYNFNIELDITKNDRQGDMFSRDPYNFDELMQVNDLTAKSDKSSFRRGLPSETNKSRLLEGMFNTQQNDDIFRSQQHSQGPVKDQGKIYEADRKSSNTQKTPVPTSSRTELDFKSPKFGHERGEHTARTQTNSALRLKEATSLDFKKKSHPDDWDKRQKMDELSELLSRIAYYDAANNQIDFECANIRQQIQDLQTELHNPSYQEDLDNYRREISLLNQQIQKEKAIEQQLMLLQKQVEKEEQMLLQEVRTLKVERPINPNSEANLLIAHIQKLHSQLVEVERDQMDLNLSQTLQLGPISLETPSARSKLEYPSSFENLLAEIRKQETITEDPKFLHNLKMACLKGEWSLFGNEDVIIQVGLRKQGQVALMIQNKSVHDLPQFRMYETGTPPPKPLTLQGRSLLRKDMGVPEQKSGDMVVSLQIGYEKVNAESNKSAYHTFQLFVPTGWLFYGQFTPCNERNFSIQWDSLGPVSPNHYKPIDKRVIKSVSELEYYIPNILVNTDSNIVQGIFTPHEGARSYFQVEQRGQLIQFAVKGNSLLAALLEFLFTT